MNQNNFQLHLLTACEHLDDEYLRFIATCIQSGVSHLQLRQKNLSYKELLNFGIELKIILKDFPTKLIINDNLKLALELDADGIHLGQGDINTEIARSKLGPDKIIGLSIESISELITANNNPHINYVAASAVFPSSSKSNLKRIWGIQGLKKFCEISKHPVIAIGGIDLNNIKSIKECGINGVAIINSIHQAKNPKEYIQSLLKI